MNTYIISIILILCATFIAACSQILLKRKAVQVHKNIFSEYLNFHVLSAYGLFGFSTIASMYALRNIPLTLLVILESSGYIFILALSGILLKEKLTIRQLVGVGLIIIGIFIFGTSSN